MVMLAVRTASALAQDSQQSDPFAGLLHASLSEAVRERPMPRIALSVETVRHYSCANYAIESQVTRVGDTIRVALTGVNRPTTCLTAFGPAVGRVSLDVPPGRYMLAVSRFAESERFVIDISDTTLTLRRASDQRFIQPDTTTFWRPHPRSFFVSCGTPNVPDLCSDLRTWLLRQSGVTERAIPAAGRVGFVRYGGYLRNDYALFHYASDEALNAIRDCMTEVAAAVADAVGVGIHLQAATGERMVAWSKRALHEKHIEVPRRVTDGDRCRK